MLPVVLILQQQLYVINDTLAYSLLVQYILCIFLFSEYSQVLCQLLVFHFKLSENAVFCRLFSFGQVSRMFVLEVLKILNTNT